MSKSFDSKLANKLAKKAKQGDEEAWEQLYNMMDYPIKCIIKPYRNVIKDYQELRSLANVGLVKAVTYYKPEKGFAFITYAGHIIKGEIYRYIRDYSTTIRIPYYTKRMNTEIKKFSREFECKNNRKPTQQEIINQFKNNITMSARGNKATPDFIKECMELKSIRSLDYTMDYNNNSIHEVIPSSKNIELKTSENIELKIECRELVKKIYANLDDEERKILTDYCILERSQADIAEELGVNAVMISRKWAKIKRKARLIVYEKEELIPYNLDRLNTLTELQREVYTMKVIQKLPEKVIMDKLGLKQSSIQPILLQAKDKLFEYR